MYFAIFLFIFIMGSVYNIYLNKNYDLKADDNNFISSLQCIKEGFSFFAFLFNGLWFLASGMWVVALISFALQLSLNFLCSDMGFICSFIVSISTSFFLGSIYSDMRQIRLVKKGYSFKCSIYANSELEARLNFIHSLNYRPINDCIDNNASNEEG